MACGDGAQTPEAGSMRAGDCRRRRILPKKWMKGLGKHKKVLHNSQSVGALAQLVEQRTLNP